MVQQIDERPDVDHPKPNQIRPRQVALSQRPYRRRMGDAGQGSACAAGGIPDEALVAPLIPPAKRGGRGREVDVREVTNGIMYILARDANGATFRRICRRKAPCMTILFAGTMTTR